MKKKFNKWLDKHDEMVVNIIVWGFVIVILTISIGLTYLIANSNLPEWFKFWLLK